ncbi:hypothetical protein GGR51DRAFT_287870 [Nemania sp. FL0031]|nr:hypothetical protein GGR51DRAFT_287870 [Nemania sp. FL0031]
MSWTIPGEHKCLDDAVKEAHNKGIVMFGSASDQGAKRSNKPYMANEPYIANKQYMAKLAKGGQGPVICIAGARDFGLADERARSEGEFFFPGHINGIPAPLPPLKSNFGAKTGSSVATALAAGLAALIMLLVDMSPKYSGRPPTTSRSALSYREQLQDPMNFRRIFKTMLQQSEINTPSGESRNEIIIPVDMVFHPEDLNKELLEVHTDSRWEKGIFLLDEVLEPILRYASAFIPVL